MDTLGRYKIIKEIGRGGMASVYEGFDPALGRGIAIKVLPAQFTHDPSFAARFTREARILAGLDHPSILPIYDYGQEDNQPYLVMRLLATDTLAHRLRQGPLSAKETLDILQPIASALDYAHQRGVLHRDIKPSNIGFDDQDRPFLMDFGLAKLNENPEQLTGRAVLGTPEYMSPEQVTGENIGSSSDLYSLGIVAFEMVTGSVPFTMTGTPISAAMAHVMKTPPYPTSLRPELPQAVDRVLLKILAKTPQERYPTASDFVAALIEAFTGITPRPIIPESVPKGALPYEDIPFSSIGTPVFPTEKRPVWDRVVQWLQTTFGTKKAAKEQPKRVERPYFPPTIQITPPTPAPFSPPPSVIQMGSPSLILQPHVQTLLDPVERSTIRELLSQQEPERIVNHIVAFNGGRFLITGYGSFGGTALTREIGEMVRREMGESPLHQQQVLLILRLNQPVGQNDFELTVQQTNGKEVSIGRLSPTDATMPQGLHVINNFLLNQKESHPLRKSLEQILRGQPAPSKLLLVIDKIHTPETLTLFISHPLLQHTHTTLICVVEQESYNRWDAALKKQLKSRHHFQEWRVPSLWEPEHQVIRTMMNLMFSSFRLDTPEAKEKVAAFEKHIAFVGRGQLGTILYELRQMRYWQIDKSTHQAFIALATLDDGLIQQNAWVQDMLEANWSNILGTSFAGEERTDRAKQGVYALMDWVVEAATFTLEEVLAEAANRPVFITASQRLRDDVVIRLLHVLVTQGYLQQSQNGYDVVWGRDKVERPKTGERRGSRQQLFEQVDDAFNEEELKNLCFRLNVEYDSLPATGKTNKARELVAALERNGRIPELTRLIRELRPHLD